MATAEAIDGEILGDLEIAERMPQSLMLLKMENETIMAAARVQPRNPMVIVEQLKQLIEAYPAAAEEAIYSRPVGSVSLLTCSKCRVEYESPSINQDTDCPACQSKAIKDKHNSRKVTKFAEGLSIRAAETIRSIFGYTRLAVTMDTLADGSAKISGTIVDYSAGNLTSDERIVSRLYKARGGEMVKTPEDRFLNVVVKAEKSKLKRDIILDTVPGIIKALFRDECEKKLLSLVAPELIEQKVLPAFAEYGITLEHLEKMIGRPLKMGWKEEDRLQLRKVLTSLKSQEITANDLLRDIAGGEAAATVGNSASNPKASKSDLTAKLDATDPESLTALKDKVALAMDPASIEAIRTANVGPDSPHAADQWDVIDNWCNARLAELKPKAKGQKDLLDRGSELPQ